MNRFITTTKTKQIDSSNYSVVLLSSIPQERMVYGPAISLYPVNSTDTVLDAQYSAIRSIFPKSSVFLVVGHNASQVINRCPKGIHIIENQKYDECGECEELKLGVNASITDNIVVICGNIIFDEMALLQIKTNHSSVIIDRNSNDTGAIGLIDNQSRLESMSFGLADKWCGISLFRDKELSSLKSIVNTKSKSNICLFEVINGIITRKGIIYTIQHRQGSIQRIHK